MPQPLEELIKHARGKERHENSMNAIKEQIMKLLKTKQVKSAGYKHTVGYIQEQISLLNDPKMRKKFQSLD